MVQYKYYVSFLPNLWLYPLKIDLDTYYNTKPGISLLLRPFLVLIEDQPSRIIKTKLGLNRRPKKRQAGACFGYSIFSCTD